MLRIEKLDKRHDLSSFSSGEDDLDIWLREYALSSARSGSSQTYVALDGEKVIGYYSLCSSSVRPDFATERAMKGQPKGRSVPAILLARLAVASDRQGAGIGAGLLKDALQRCISAAEVIAARVIIVHALHQKAQNFYTKYGFEEGPENLTLMILMKDARQILTR